MKMLLSILLLLPAATNGYGRVGSFARRICAASISGALFISGVSPVLADTLAEQLQALQSVQVGKQRLEVQTAEQDMIAQQLQYPPGKLIARGIISLTTTGLQPSQFPMGLEYAAMIDEAFAKDTATMTLLAVGREGPPLAAKRYKLSDIVFPLVWEMTTDDLIFPYTPDAWESSALSKDTIAVTAILNSEGKLTDINAVQRIGFATSDPTVVAGTAQRSNAAMIVANKIDPKLYNPEELQLLGGVDNEIDRIEKERKAAANTNKGSKPRVVPKPKISNTK